MSSGASLNISIADEAYQKKKKEKKNVKHKSSGLLLQGDDSRWHLWQVSTLGCPICYPGTFALRQSPRIDKKRRHSPGQCPDSGVQTQASSAVKMSLPVPPLHEGHHL